MDKVFVTRSSMPGLDEYVKEISPLFESHYLTNAGVKHEELKKELRAYLDSRGLELTVNGHMALELVIQAFGLKGEVITTPFTFCSTTHAIVRSGLKPVFADVDPKSCTLDPDCVERLITPDTCAILPVHVYGNMCDVDRLGEIAARHGLKVIYDAAHTFGVRYRGRSAVSFGDASILSFHATKVFNTIEGGAAASDSEQLGDRIRVLRDFGIVDEQLVTDIGPNAKMNEFAAAMGLCNLRHVEGEIARRRKVHERYVELLESVEGIRLNPPQEDVEPNYAYFPVFVDEKAYGEDRDALFERLKENGIFARKYFYPMVTDLKCYRDVYDSSSTPVARALSHQVLTLPMYADLSMEDVDRIAGIISKK